MTKLTISSILFIIFFLAACGQDYGNKLESTVLDIYFTNKNDEKVARNIAAYWKKNNILGTKKQYLQLNRNGEILELKLISTQKFDPSTLSYDERAVLLALQDSLQPLAKPDPLELVISDRQFKSVYNINQ